MVREQATPLPDLLYKNAPPNELDVEIIQKRSETTDKRIAELRSELEYLEEQRYLQKCVFCPARRIPTEVLTMIFDLVSTKPPPRYGNSINNFVDDLWERDKNCLSKISRVCWRWRDIAYSSGHLWAMQRARIPTLTQEQCGTLLRWYGRSEGTPKTLKLDILSLQRPSCECYKQGETQLCSNAVLQRLLEEGAPFSRISMRMLKPACFKSIVRYIKSTAGTNGTTTSAAQHWWDQVQELVLDFGGNDRDWLRPDPPAQSIFATDSFPDSLNSLTLDLTRLAMERQTFLDIPAAMLRKLITFSLTPLFFTALQHCTNVENLSLYLRDDEYSCTESIADLVNVTHDGHVVLPKVKSLRLRIKDVAAVAKHLSLLRFPGLLELSIACDYDHNRPAQYSTILKAIGMFSPDAPQALASLSVAGNIYTRDLYNLFSSITSPVTHLATDATFDPREFLRLARATAGTSNLLPSLQFLEVRDFPSDFHLDSLFLYIKSRQKHGKKKGKIVMKPPYDRLKWVMLKITWSERDLQKAYYKESATLRMLRESFGIKVDRMGYDPELEESDV
ncbi:hypothetical protein D9611_013279 [Ephemerocybe angulata]|uniref:F-box domain-containing protein n=1 Tax=Ephemerocybe angulata TaxID=980116 RepID=A0A8H5FJB2_9AGAR|nr:hypothetical protein D9611_013279 [Tulosesus angulatus]